MNSNLKVHSTFTDYAVSRDGEVYSLITNKKLKPTPNGNGYLMVSLYKDKKSHTRRVNRLVLETYNPIENDHLYDAHHDNEVRDDNRLENLMWELKAEHIREHKKGAKRSEETKRRISEILKGVKKSEETRNRMSEANKGKVLSGEHKRKVSESLRGHLVSEETKKKMSEAKIGIKKSEETKKKMGEAQRGMLYWNNGTKIIKSKVCPGDGWVRGRIRS